PNILLPVNPHPAEGPKAEEMRKWGADPALGHSLVNGLTDSYRVIAFDYDGHNLSWPKPNTLTPDNVVRDILAVADAVGADRFAYYGYSWLGMIGLQLALRTDRLSALIMGGFPPINGPYVEMLPFFEAVHAQSGAQRAHIKVGGEMTRQEKWGKLSEHLPKVPKGVLIPDAESHGYALPKRSCFARMDRRCEKCVVDSPHHFGRLGTGAAAGGPAG
ncbi:MAG TPA: alpha/beta hydrolase, partial [Anaerolineales bacterium]|nr:alpha/beta hydrolase [Anaerolineales bacterium]